MENLNKLFDEITQELTSEGQLFEVREYINKKGFKSKEYASFPDSLKGYFDSVSYTHLRAHETV